jgi:hypothetical protein
VRIKHREFNPCFSASPVKRQGDNEVSTVVETRALRTNRIWSKGRVENTSLAENSAICGLLKVSVLSVISVKIM